MFKSLLSLTGSLAVGLSLCFAEAAQAQPASPAKQVSQDVKVFSMDPVAAQKRPQKSGSLDCCFCDRNAVVPPGWPHLEIIPLLNDQATKANTLAALRLQVQPALIDRAVRPSMSAPRWFPTTAAFRLARRPYFSSISSPSDIREINLDDLKKIIQRDPKDARPLLINFWATWCDPCREEFPDLVKIDLDYRSKGLKFVAISLDDISDIRTAVPKFLKEMKAEMPVVLLNVNDPEPAIKAVDPTWDGQLPATFLYDKEGKVVFKHFGKIDAAELRAAIDKASATKQ